LGSRQIVEEIALRFEQIIEKGMPAMVKILWNEEYGYFIHKLGNADTEKHGSINDTTSSSYSEIRGRPPLASIARSSKKDVGTPPETLAW